MIRYRSIKKYKYQLLEAYKIRTGIKPRGRSRIDLPFVSMTLAGQLTIKKGYAWDGPSGPSIDTKTFMRGSLVHDVLYQLIRMKKIHLGDRREADELLRQICLEDGMSRFRAWYVFKSVRRFGGKHTRKRGGGER